MTLIMALLQLYQQVIAGRQRARVPIPVRAVHIYRVER